VPCSEQCLGADGKSVAPKNDNLFNWGVIDNTQWGGGVKKPSEHFTMIFNAFVMMQVFNEINARKIHGERNVFKGIFNNPLFYIIVVGTFFTQIALIELAGVIFSCTKLSLGQWIICTLLGLFELLWGQVITCIPNSVLPNFKKQSNEPNTQQTTVDHPSADKQEEVNRGQILWFRGLNRIQQQINLARQYKLDVRDMRAESLLKLTPSIADLAQRAKNHSNPAEIKNDFFEELGCQEEDVPKRFSMMVESRIEKALSVTDARPPSGVSKKDPEVATIEEQPPTAAPVAAPVVPKAPAAAEPEAEAAEEVEEPFQEEAVAPEEA